MDNFLKWFNFSIEPIPEYKAAKDGTFVKYGADNNYNERLIELFDRSTFHNAILLGKADFIAGSGIDYNKDLPDKELAILEKFINEPNKFQTLHDIIRNDAINLVLYGGVAHKVNWWIGQNGFNLYDQDFGLVRKDTEETKLYTRDTWKGISKPDKDTQEFAPFNPENRKGQQLNYNYIKRPGKKYYPAPEYLSAMEAIVVDYLFTNFHKNNIENGFASGTFIELPYGEDWDAETKRKFEAKMKSKSTGTDKAGGLLLSFLNAQMTQRTQITPMQPNNLDKQFTIIDGIMQQRIFTGHRITSPMLFGIKEAGQLGGRNEVLDSYELLHSTYVSPRQQYIERILNEYTKALGVSDAGLKIKKSQPIGLDIIELQKNGLVNKDFAVAFVAETLGVAVEDIREQVNETDKNKQILDAINSVSPLIANKIVESLTDDEMRSLVGLAPKTAEQKVGETQMSSEHCEGCEAWKDEDWKVFEKFGLSSEEFDAEFEPVLFTFAVDKKEIEILNLLKNNPKLGIGEIADIMKLDVKDATEMLNFLRDEKLLILPNSGGGNMVVTPNGELAIEEYGSAYTNIETRFKYEKDPTASGETILPTSRDFCKEMVKLNRVYTREDIDKLSTLLGYNVWKRRGGWYTVKNSDPAIHVPHCRHLWSQIIVRKRVKP